MRPLAPALGASPLAALLLAGCQALPPSTGGEPAMPGVPVPERFVEGPRHAARATFGSDRWWTTLGDRNLEGLVGTALRSSLELRKAETRVAAARAALQQAEARLFPALDSSGTLSDRWGPGSGSGRAGLGSLLDWEVDLFGRLRSARRASERELHATEADLAGIRLFLSTAVAESYYGRSEQELQLALLAEQIEVGEKLLQLTRFRFGQGQASIVDVLQQEQQLKSTRALVPEVEARVSELGYVLDALLARSPGTTRAGNPSALPEPPPLPTAGLPSDLLLRRPDLVAARERIGALDARLAVAVAEQLPILRLTAASSIQDGAPTSLVTNLVGSAVAPLFEAGSRKAEVVARRAELEGAVAEFGQSFLDALRDVETALVNERKQGEQLDLLTTRLQSANRLLEETRNRYSKGLTDYLPVLTAVTTVQQVEREILRTRRDRISQRIALHRALGGPMD